MLNKFFKKELARKEKSFGPRRYNDRHGQPTMYICVKPKDVIIPLRLKYQEILFKHERRIFMSFGFEHSARMSGRYPEDSYRPRGNRTVVIARRDFNY